MTHKPLTFKLPFLDALMVAIAPLLDDERRLLIPGAGKGIVVYA